MTGAPFNTEMTCLDSFDGSVIDSDLNGRVLVLSTKIDSVDRFYCAVSRPLVSVTYTCR